MINKIINHHRNRYSINLKQSTLPQLLSVNNQFIPLQHTQNQQPKSRKSYIKLQTVLQKQQYKKQIKHKIKIIIKKDIQKLSKSKTLKQNLSFNPSLKPIHKSQLLQNIIVFPTHQENDWQSNPISKCKTQEYTFKCQKQHIKPKIKSLLRNPIKTSSFTHHSSHFIYPIFQNMTQKRKKIRNLIFNKQEFKKMHPQTKRCKSIFPQHNDIKPWNFQESIYEI